MLALTKRTVTMHSALEYPSAEASKVLHLPQSDSIPAPPRTLCNSLVTIILAPADSAPFEYPNRQSSLAM